MKLSELIKNAETLLAAEGDLDVYNKDFYEVISLRLEEADGLPSDWNMPDGMKMIVIQDYS